MNITEIHLYSQSQPMILKNCLNTYTKESLFCVMLESGEVHKFPLQHIFRIRGYKENEK